MDEKVYSEFLMLKMKEEKLKGGGCSLPGQSSS